MQNSKEEVIDLTSLDYFIPLNKVRVPPIVCDEIIDLVNESFESQERNKRTDVNKKDKRKSKVKDMVKKSTEIKSSQQEENSLKIGCCSICWEKLGKKPLASTKCGHVYCLICLEKSLKYNKRCPTCRYLLKGATAYHPLYLELD